MDRSIESTNEGGSSPDTLIARSSSEEEKRKSVVASISGEYVTALGDSSSSLDTLTGGSVAALSSSVNADDRKRGKFGAFKSSFREGSLFKIKKKSRGTGLSLEAEQDDKEIPQQQRFENEKDSNLVSEVLLNANLKKKKKKSHSLVRKLSLNKFRISSEQQELRHTPEGGNSSQSQSRSSQESPIHTSSSTGHIAKKENDDALEGEKGAKEEFKKPEKLLEKPTKTVIVQRKSPSLTIKAFAVQQDSERHSQQENQENTSRSDVRCSSTLPYALSRWPERNETKFTHPEDPTARKSKAKYDSDSSECIPSTSSPVEVRRKLSLLEEKRAIFQRRFFDSESKSDATVIDVNTQNELSSDEFLKQREEEGRKKVRHISVRTFDTFSIFGNTLDEEDLSEDCNGEGSSYRKFYANMAPILGVVDHPESSSNNAPNLGVNEKREHLYKILVIGELGAGKTSIIKRYVHQFFSQHYRATIGVDFALKVLNWDPHTIIRLQLWDIAGQERFGNMTRVYYKEAVGAFIVFDVTRSATLDAVVKWKQDLDSKVQLPDGSPIPCVLLANKCDQQKEGLVNSPTKMDDYCKEKNFSGWFETSAKENINIEEAARFLVNKILQNDQVIRDNGIQDQMDNDRFALNQSPTGSKKSCSC
ncbi:uncharacterized protein LOC105428830 isoform X1 [Pogonomyrmex barbatus]|uniref:Uncharacterized protein LOC105428830 isoform X1 n=1 Tax=Pogonomyrmex barbatus TaxID=144034 RepID=A0A6I9WF73_9HYME|nr:uncharacterized protein LOC105428830 isoform X1 [Pogonomyrmex barbatus]